MVTVRQGLSLEEFLRLPEEKPALEYEADGTVTQKVAPQGKHSRLQLMLSNRLNDFAEPARLAMAFPELRTTFAGASYVPDVALYLWDRIPWDANGEVPDEFYEPPDIAIEILSPEQRRNRLRARCEWYVEHGVRLSLLVDPRTRQVDRFRPGARLETLQGDDQIDFAPILAGLQLTVDELFGWLRGGR